jgi:O-antigen biosynthesis protein
MHQLEILREDEQGVHWKATGNDPHFSLTPRDGRGMHLKAGWYWIAIDMSVEQGALTGPRLYINYGGGFSEDASINLSPLRTVTGFEGLICLLDSVEDIRLDPSMESCTFSLQDISFRRLGKLEAFKLMFSSLQEHGESVSAIFRALLGSFKARGLRGVGDWMYGSYVGAGVTDIGSYATWIEAYDQLHDVDRAAIYQRIDRLPYKPLISLVLPVYNTPEKWLRRCLDTVIFQLYPNWELCVADDASPQPYVRKVLEEYARKDERIKIVFRQENGHISRSSNSAIEISTGEYIALIDHDDELPEHALYMVVEAINEHPDAKLIYSDEDKIDEKGVRFDPYFKSDWNPDLFRGHNMISHLGVYKASLVRELGGFRVGYEGSQDYDLALRVIEKIERHEIIHIPHVLYHWRAIAGSTALGPGEKNYAHVAAQKSLMAHLERIGLKGEFKELPRFMGNWSFKPELMARPKISIIIPTRDGLAYLSRCVESIRAKSTYKNYEILVVDNQSEDAATLRYMDDLVDSSVARVVRYDEPFNFSAINNFAVKQASGELLLFLNNDTAVITQDWLQEMAAHVMRPEVGAVGAMLYYPDNTVQHAGIVLGLGAAGVAGHSYHLKSRGYPGQMCRMHLAQEVSGVTAACLMMRRDVFEKIGGYDETFKVAFNDVDLCLRIREAGYVVIWTPRAELYHYESVSRGSDFDDQARKDRFAGECARMRARWVSQIDADPYFNPNLRLDMAGFEFGASRAVRPWKMAIDRKDLP